MQVPIPQPVLDLLVVVRPNWGSHEWTSLFRDSWTRVSPGPPRQCTAQRYSKFCQEHSQPPLPLSEHTLCQFTAVMSQELTWKTIRIYLSALRFFQIRAGLPLSSFPRLTYVLKGIHRLTPDHQRKHRLPITLQLLRTLHRVWSIPPMQYNYVMLWAACCLGFFGVLHAGEFTCAAAETTDTPLSPSDVSVDSRDSPQLVVVHLRQTRSGLSTLAVGSECDAHKISIKCTT